MNPMMGWVLAVAALIAGWTSYGWQGVILALSVIVFWLLLQFSRALRAMRNASGAPVGHIGSAVMLQSKLRPGMTMLKVVGMTRSLGRKRDDLGPDVWAWQDEGGSSVTLSFEGGRLVRWELRRPETAAEPAAEAHAAMPARPAEPPPAA